jgi:hypothetical protein
MLVSLVSLEMPVRRGLVLAPLLLGPVLAAACASSNSAANGFTNGFDSGAADSSVSDTGLPSADTGTGLDAQFPDGGFEAGSLPVTSIIFVNASRSLESVRLCFIGGGGGNAPPFPSDNEMPASNYPGIPAGGAVWMPDASAIPSTATVYAVPARYLATSTIPADTPCSMLICPTGMTQTCLMQGFYWKVGPIAQSAAPPGKTTVFAISGCTGVSYDSLADSERCGQDYDAGMGNLHLDLVSLPPGIPVEGGLMVQAAQFSPGLASLQGDAGTTNLSFGSMADAQAVGQLGAEGTVATAGFLPLPAGLAAYGQVGFAVDVQGVDAGPTGQLWMSLAQAQELVDPAQDPAVYYAGGSYVVAVVGDPFAPHAFADGDGGYDGKGLHVLVLPATAAMP